MEFQTFTCSFERFSSREEITAEHQTLLDASIEAMANAYAPYSGFSVGASLLLENGTIVTGSNQENAAYPSGLCAERVAFFAAGAQFPNQRIIAAAVVASSASFKSGEPVTPCGSCRQSMLEYELKQQHNILLYMISPSGEIVASPSIKQLLPLYFESKGKF
ncbi:MAG: cytidine deaminase [Flavobacteriales bacterium]